MSGQGQSKILRTADSPQALQADRKEQASRYSDSHGKSAMRGSSQARQAEDHVEQHTGETTIPSVPSEAKYSRAHTGSGSETGAYNPTKSVEMKIRTAPYVKVPKTFDMDLQAVPESGKVRPVSPRKQKLGPRSRLGSPERLGSAESGRPSSQGTKRRARSPVGGSTAASMSPSDSRRRLFQFTDQLSPATMETLYNAYAQVHLCRTCSSEWTIGRAYDLQAFLNMPFQACASCPEQSKATSFIAQRVKASTITPSST